MRKQKAELNRLVQARPELLEKFLLFAQEPPANSQVRTPEDLLPYLEPILCGRLTEALVVVALDRRRKVLAVETLSIGSDRATVVDPRQVFHWAFRLPRLPAEVVLAHNHPSGDPAPSEQDKEVTRAVLRAGQVLGVTLLDHLVLGSPGSFRCFSRDHILPAWG